MVRLSCCCTAFRIRTCCGVTRYRPWSMPDTDVIVPDLRGFGESSKPANVESYGVLDLVGDVLGILDAVGAERAHVVGHDWGAALAWAMAAFVPDRVDHLAALSVGHPSAFRDVGFAQREKSWYMLFFQFEGIAEQWLSADDFANMRAWSSHPDMDRVVSDLARPGALTAALNWYRANVHPRTWIEPPMVFPQVQAPTMGVWSSGDFALAEAGMTGSRQLCRRPVPIRARRRSRPLDAARSAGSGVCATG